MADEDVIPVTIDGQRVGVVTEQHADEHGISVTIHLDERAPLEPRDVPSMSFAFVDPAVTDRRSHFGWEPMSY
jgi:hypothetical protein